MSRVYPLPMPKTVQILDDGFGNQWEKCGEDCELEIVRPGKVQCERNTCPYRITVPRDDIGDSSNG